ncbi:M16 family metallopeptidase [Sphingosinicella humi]|uniref:Peptidase M16 n=1 Tax=Allosphingosinicella humi TaxID=2068657 RepID=A0A2U2J1U4_9SPHN|nr:pitrilysin family protein [Sphingosinicella humi]PWG02309.1 peptidase M16 [Sphingosinicella humi]
MRLLKLPITLLSALALAACSATTVSDSPAPAAVAANATAQAPAPAPISELVQAVDIPYEQFTLDNGLRVVVHEDRKAPVVAVSIWYNVGSKDEPEGKTGFAHLFEHLMFNGSENAPGEYFEPLARIGATDLNGTTWFDRTNYFQTVPRAALETVLFLESDRMGHLLGAVTQEKLDNQRGVVQNEKRQGDNQPYGLVEYAQLEALFPEGHPYAHSTIGSMADLDAASLADVKKWFTDNYGPNNAVLVLAGDINAAEARPLVDKYFGDIPRGPENVPAEASVPTLATPVTEVMKDKVATVRLYRNWVVPGLLDPEMVPLDVGASILGGLASSRLDNELVRQDQTAVRVSANLQPFHRLSIFEVQVDVKPGQDPEPVAQRLDAIIADLIAKGPSEDEVSRAVTSVVANRIKGLEEVGGFGGKAVALAEGALYANDPSFYKKQLAAYAEVTPATVQAALQKWLTRPAYVLRVVPGERDPYQEAEVSKAGGVTQRPRYYRAPGPGEQPLAPEPQGFVQVDRSKLPEVGPIADLDFPDVERSRLSNGIEVVFARRAAVPVVLVAVEFDAGYAADPDGKAGLQNLMASLLDEGTTSMNSRELAEARERLGAGIDIDPSLDRTTVTLSALEPNLAASLALMADIVKNPAFDPGEIERLRAQQLAGIASELTQPVGIALRTLPPLLYGEQHPYGTPFTGSGHADDVKALTREDIVAAHQRWIRPDNAQIFVVGNSTLAEIAPLLEANFGDWALPATPKGTKTLDGAIPAPKPRIVLIDRPQSPQSLILAGSILPVQGTDDLTTLLAANEVLGGSFLSRLNTELRETKGWAYGVQGFVNRVEHRVPYIVYAPVQTDKTGPSIAALQEQMNMFLSNKGVTPDELSRTINGSIRELPGSYETSSEVLGAIEGNALYDRPDNYQETLASRYKAMTAAELDQAARTVIDPKQLVWVVVGDAAKVRPQLDALGLPVETMTLE